MSNIKLVHSGGNSVSLTTPTNNPASNITFKLPQADGTANQVLKTDGNGALSVGADQGGKVLKYAKVVYSTEVSSSNTSYVDSGLSATIQPSAAGSKILVMLSQFFNVNVANPNVGAAIQLLEGSNVIVPSQTWEIYYFPGLSGNNSKNYMHRYNVTMIHTPSYSLGDTLTFKSQMKVLSDGNTTNVKAQKSGSSSYLTLMELAG